MNFWKRMILLPPVAVRLLARQRWGRPLTSREIADKSGLTVGQVEFVSERTSWDGVEVAVFRRFTSGCGLDFFDRKAMKRVRAYLASHPRYTYLRSSPDWSSYYRPMLARWREAMKNA